MRRSSRIKRNRKTKIKKGRPKGAAIWNKTYPGRFVFAGTGMKRNISLDPSRRFQTQHNGGSFADRSVHRPVHAIRPVNVIGDPKARQSQKIRQLGEALMVDGYHALDEQARVLGLSRSTTWTILKANHKNSGLSAAIINRMLAAPTLPPRVRLKIFEYIEEKRAGLYGDDPNRVRRFAARISAQRSFHLHSD